MTFNRGNVYILQGFSETNKEILNVSFALWSVPKCDKKLILDASDVVFLDASFLLSCWPLQCAAVLFVDENEHVDVGCLKQDRSTVYQNI